MTLPKPRITRSKIHPEFWLCKCAKTHGLGRSLWEAYYQWLAWRSMGLTAGSGN